METIEMEQSTGNRYSQWLRLQNWFIHTRFSSGFLKFMSWILYYFCFCKAALFVSGLVFSHKLVDFSVLRILITYFSNYSIHKPSLKKAAILTNFQKGLSATFVIVATRYSYNSPTRPLKIMIGSTISYTIGLFVLYFTLEKFPVSTFDLCNVIGIIFLAVGKAGVKPLLGAFLTNQIRHHNEQKENHNDKQTKAQKKLWWLLASCCSVITTIVTYNFSWEDRFKWTGIIMGISLILFSLGYVSYLCKWDSLSYHCKELTFDGNPFIVLRVIKASLKNRYVDYPCSKDQYLCNSKDELHILPNDEGKFYISPTIKFLRWLDKAAIKESSSTPDGQRQRNAARFCSVSQVRESKLLLRLFPMWSSFLVFGLVLSAGDTFFPEQGNNLRSEQFMTAVLIFKPILRETISSLLKSSIRKWVPTRKKRQAQIVRILMGMVISVFCCTAAWRVEVHRLIVVRSEGLLDEPDESIPMSIFWLVPQFCLLGLMEGLAVNGLDEYISDHFPEWMNDHVSAINESVVGIGSYLHIFFVLVNKSLFADTLNHSRLDKYYMRLAIVSYVNMCYNGYLSTFYIKSENARVDDRLET